MNRRIAVISFFACLAVPLLARGQMTYISQTRTVSASATGSPSGADESAIQSAPDFSHFNGEVHYDRRCRRRFAEFGARA